MLRCRLYNLIVHHLEGLRVVVVVVVVREIHRQHQHLPLTPVHRSLLRRQSLLRELYSSLRVITRLQHLQQITQGLDQLLLHRALVWLPVQLLLLQPDQHPDRIYPPFPTFLP